MKLFHISFSNLGEETTLTPRIPADAHKSEVDFARVCAAPTLEGCVDSLSRTEKVVEGKKSCKLVGFVYEVDAETFKKYDDVFDAEITSEHISVQPVQAKMVGMIHIPAVKNAGYLDAKNTHKTSKGEIFEVITSEVYENYYR